MKMLFITSSSINGGAQKHIREMFKSLSGLGHDLYLIAPSGWLTEELSAYEDKVIRMNLGLNTVYNLTDEIKKIKPDITNTFILSGGVFGTLAWRKKKYGELFVTVNNPVIYPGISTIGRILYPCLYRWMSRYASAFLVKSDMVRDEVATVIQHKTPVISIKNGIDFSIFDKDKEYQDIRYGLGIKEDDIVITNVAALDNRKGQEYLIVAAIELRKVYPIHVLLVGEGNDGERLKNIVKEKMADGYIHFLGRRSDINCILANSNIFVLSSIHEGLPNSLMEAMAMGLPCVATDVGGVRQLIDSADKGIVVRSESSDEIANAIEKVLANKELSMRMSQNAYQKMYEEYSQAVATRQLLSIYEGVEK